MPLLKQKHYRGRPLGLALAWLTVCCFCLGRGSSVLGQWSDSFEGGEPRWLQVDSDCGAQLTEQEISLLMPHGGRTCELLELACGHGTMALLAYPIEPCAIIEEFQPQLWTRCSSGRIQLGVRVLFPFATHPVTGGRLSTILWGSSYSETGQWQMLKVSNLVEQLRLESIALRKRFGSSIRLEGAFIDSLVVNAYTGPGRYRLQLDDLSLPGMVTLAAIGNPPPENWRQQWRWRSVVPSEESRYWAAPGAPALWLQYRGEPMRWVRSLGFTGIVMEQLPSREKLAEAQQSGLHVISPPPSYPIEFPAESLTALKGWLIGAALDGRQTEYAKQQAERVSALPVAMHRPLIAEALEDFFQFSRLADEVIIPQPLPTAAGGTQDKIDWLASRLRTTKQRSDGWVSVNLGIPPTLSQQLETAMRIVAPDADRSDLSVDPLGFRHQLIGAALSGGKGFFLRTFRTLDVQNAADSAQIAALRWIQNDLRLWGPWIVSGQSVQPPAVNDAKWVCACWRISESQLVLAQATPEGSQYCVPPTLESPLELGLPTNLVGQQVFRLTTGALERVETETTPAGLKWRVERPAPVESFIISANPTVIDFARRHLEMTAAQNAADQAEVVGHNLGLAARLISTRSEGDVAADGSALAHLEALRLAQQQLDSGLQALRSRQPIPATRLLLEASDKIQQVLFDGFQNAQQNLASPQSSPLVTTPAGLHLHWLVADACSRSVWQQRDLPGGDFSDLNTMLQTGWSQQRRLEDQVNLRVELIPRSDAEAAGLRLAAYALRPEQPVSGGFEGASLRVRSAATHVEAGQLIRVSARARVLHSSQESGSGLLIYDNQVGPSLGQLIRADSSRVQPVELYRFAVADGEFRLLAECRGECDIVLDSVRISVIKPARNESSYSTRPLDRLLMDSLAPQK